MKSLDSDLAAWIKSLGAAKTVFSDDAQKEAEVAALRREFPQPALAFAIETILRLATLPSSERPVEISWSLVQNLVAARMPKSAAATVGFAIEALSKLPPAETAGRLPDAVSVERWRKAAKIPAPELARTFLADLQAAAEVAGLDWLLAYCPADHLQPGLSFLLEQISSGAVGTMATARVLRYLTRDLKGTHLAALISATEDQPRRLRALAATIRLSTKATGKVADNLPRLCHPKVPNLPLGALVREIFASAGDTAGKERMRTCGALARIGAGLLLLETRSAAGEEALHAVAEIGCQLRNLTHETNLAHWTWVLSPLDQPTHSDVPMITPEGARRWAFAYEEAERSGVPLVPLETLGFNLGLRRIVVAGEKIEFQPQRHQDVEGGLLPGDPAVALTGGWSFCKQPLIRARVRPTPTH